MPEHMHILQSQQLVQANVCGDDAVNEGVDFDLVTTVFCTLHELVKRFFLESSMQLLEQRLMSWDETKPPSHRLQAPNTCLRRLHNSA